MNANCLPAAWTDPQLMEPCQSDTSTPATVLPPAHELIASPEVPVGSPPPAPPHAARATTGTIPLARRTRRTHLFMDRSLGASSSRRFERSQARATPNPIGARIPRENPS